MEKVDIYASPVGLEASPHYSIKVSQGDRSENLFVYLSEAQWRTNVSKDVSYAMFAFEGKVSVEVRRHGERFDSARVLPSSRAINVMKTGDNAISFTLREPGQFAIEFDESIQHPLVLFADAPEEAPPESASENLIYFGPGEHHLGIPGLILKPYQQVYLAPGAFVKGRIYGQDAPGVRIFGRGVLSGQHLPGQPVGEWSVPHMIHLTGTCPGALIEGITIVGSPHYNIVAEGSDSVVRNVKMIGWWFGTDGVSLGPKGLVEGCFFKVNDDAIKLYSSGMEVRGCTFWQMENGAVFQFSWNLNHDQSGFVVRDCDIIRVEHREDANNRGIFAAIHGGAADLSDYLFEDIRIENANWRFLLLTAKKTVWARSDEVGSIRDIVWRGISCTEKFQMPSIVKSYESGAVIDGLVFEQITVGSETADTIEDLGLRRNPEETPNVRVIGVGADERVSAE